MKDNDSIKEKINQDINIEYINKNFKNDTDTLEYYNKEIKNVNFYSKNFLMWYLELPNIVNHVCMPITNSYKKKIQKAKLDTKELYAATSTSDKYNFDEDENNFNYDNVYFININYQKPLNINTYIDTKDFIKKSFTYKIPYDMNIYLPP